VIAVKRALQAALLAAQNKTISHNPYGAEVSSLSIVNKETDDVTFHEEKSFQETFSTALQILQKNKITTRCFTLHAESIFNENLAGIYGMTLIGEESI
jgi:hypothetical protein